MRIVIHAGMHKTGTTSLQLTMLQNRAALLKHGVFYPDAPLGQHGFLIDAGGPKPNYAAFAIARKAAERAGAKLLFLSAEMISHFSMAQLRELRSAFPADEVTLLYCFRHWHGFWPSQWSQNVRRRDSQGFATYLEMISRATPAHPDLHFASLLNRATALDNTEVVAVSFERAIHGPDGLVSALLQAARLSPRAIATAIAKPQRVNQRPDWRVLETIRMLNGVLADRLRLPQDEICLGSPFGWSPRNFFDIATLWGRLTAAMADELCAIMEAHHRVVTADRDTDVAAATTELERHAAYFSNLDGGPVFDPAPRCEVTTTDLDWQSFYAQHGQLADEALRRIETRRQ